MQYFKCTNCNTDDGFTCADDGLQFALDNIPAEKIIFRGICHACKSEMTIKVEVSYNIERTPSGDQETIYPKHREGVEKHEN